MFQISDKLLKNIKCKINDLKLKPCTVDVTFACTGCSGFCQATCDGDCADSCSGNCDDEAADNGRW